MRGEAEISREHSRRRGLRGAWLLSLALCLATFGLYLRTAANGFVDFDDLLYVVENPNVRNGLTASGIGWAITSRYAANWHPLTWWSHQTDVQLFGLNPAGHHLMSAAIHAISAALLLLALEAMTGALWPSALAAALFALHPLHVESVAWAAERKDVLLGLLFMVVLLLHAGYARKPGWGRYLAVAGAYLLALMAKPMGVTIPFVLLLLDVWPLGRFGGPALLRGGWRGAALPVLEKAPLLMLSAASSVITFLAQQKGGAMNLVGSQHVWVRISNALVSYVRYLGKTVWPAGMAVFYPMLRMRPLWQVAGSIALLAGLTATAFLLLRRRPYLSVGWLWYLGTLVPVIGLVQVGGQAFADRYTYLPLIGVFVAASWLLAAIPTGPRGTWAVGAGAGLLLAVLSVLTWRQEGFWRDTGALFGHTISVTEDNWLAHNNYGLILQQRGKYDEAISHLREAARITRGAEVYSNLGNVLDLSGRYQEAIAAYNLAIRIDPNTVVGRYNLANTLSRLGRDNEALALYEAALRLDPGHSQAHNNLAIVLSRLGRSQEALRHYSEAQRLDPGNAEAHNNMGVELIRLGRVEEAAGHYRRAIAARPGYLTAMVNLADALDGAGRKEEALVWYREVLRLSPGNARAREVLRP